MLWIYGASDDLCELVGLDSTDTRYGDGRWGYELGCFERDVHVTIGGEGGGVHVILRYGAGNRAGVWGAEIAQLEEGIPIPWPVTIRHQEIRPGRIGYSVAVEIDCPAGIPVGWAMMTKKGKADPERAGDSVTS
jgi:hypothetical protein